MNKDKESKWASATLEDVIRQLHSAIDELEKREKEQKCCNGK